MNGMQPQGLGRRIIGALVLLLAVSFGANLVYTWLQPLVPTLTVTVIVLALIWFFLGRFRG